MKKILLSLVAIIVISACNTEEESGPKSTGNVLVINEGNFGSSNATIGIYNTNDSTYSAAAFKSKNGYFIGDVLQSVTVIDETVYGVLNGSNMIEAFDIENLNSIETLQDPKLDKPRYMATNEDGAIGYVTVWGPYDTDYTLSNSKVLVIDLNKMEVTDSIATASGVEQILRDDNTLLVTRNYYGSFHHLSFINMNDLSLNADIELPEGPDEIIQDGEGNVWVACTSGALVKIDVDNKRIAKSLDLKGEVLGDVAFLNGEVFFLQGGNVNSINLKTEEITNKVNGITIELPYALDVNPFNGDIYLGDAVAYGSEGKVLHYNNSGELIVAFDTGIFPSQFIFN